VPPLTPGRRILINTFLIFHLVVITCWCVPLPIPFAGLVKELARPYLLWSGMFQSWDMFAPSPKTINSYVEAMVFFKNGHTKKWAFPRMEQLSFTDRYYKERYRKYVENLKEDNNSAIWADAAREIARLNSTPAAPVRMVFLIRYWSNIIPRDDDTIEPPAWDGHVFFAYNVQPGDLN